MKTRSRSHAMADRMTHDELDALSTTQLKSRVERLFNLQMNSTTTEDVRKTLDDAINAAKATLEKKELYTIMLNAQRGCRVALAKTYFNMTAQQLIVSFPLQHDTCKQLTLYTGCLRSPRLGAAQALPRLRGPSRREETRSRSGARRPCARWQGSRAW